jgi:mannosyltransferase OCH1-like enzyme
MKADFSRILIVREKGGIYFDLDYNLIRDPEPIISKYDQIFT